MAAGRKSIIRRWETQVGIGIAVACFSVLGVFLGLKVGQKKPAVPAEVVQVEEDTPQVKVARQVETVKEAEPVAEAEPATEEAEVVTQTAPAEYAEEQPVGIPDMGEMYQEKPAQSAETYEEGESKGMGGVLVQGPTGVVGEAVAGPPAVASSVDESPAMTYEEPPAVESSPQGMAVAGSAAEGVAAKETEVGYPRVHIVRPNDTLMGIAKEYYGDVSKWVLIYSANGLTDRNMLVVGQRLEIPSPDSAVKQQPVVRKASFSDARSPAIAHRVQHGDTLQKLARSYYGDESQWERIYEANKQYLSDGHTLKPGEVLIIP